MVEYSFWVWKHAWRKVKEWQCPAYFQHFNTVSKTLGGQTHWELTFQSMTAHSLIPVGHNNEPKSRTSESPWARSSKSHHFPAEAGSGKSCPHSPASSLQRSAVLCHPQESQVHCDGLQSPTRHPLAGLTGKEILITYQRLGGSVV
jgi:hypothetical protein